MFLIIVSIPFVPVQAQSQLGIGQAVSTLRDAGGVLYGDQKRWSTFFDDFYLFNTSSWDTTAVANSASAISVVDSLFGGNLKVTLPAIMGQGVNLQTNFLPVRLNGSLSKPDSNGVFIEFESKVKFNNVGETEFLTGLAIENESILAAQAYGLYFVKYDWTKSGKAKAGATLYAKEIKATQAASDSASCGTISNNTWYRLKITYNGKHARFYVNDVVKATLTTAANQPVGVCLKPTFECTDGDSVATYAYIDYMKVRQRR